MHNLTTAGNIRFHFNSDGSGHTRIIDAQDREVHVPAGALRKFLYQIDCVLGRDVVDSEGHALGGILDHCGQLWCSACQAMVTPLEASDESHAPSRIYLGHVSADQQHGQAGEIRRAIQGEELEKARQQGRREAQEEMQRIAGGLLRKQPRF